jgi:hypothetical protein
VNLYGVTLAGAEDVAGLDELPVPFTGRTVTKTLLANITRLGANPDNLEAMVFGPRLPNGRPSLILMADNNFSDTQRNQFLLLELGGIGLPATGDGAAASPNTFGDGAPTGLLLGIGGGVLLGAGLATRRRLVRRTMS